MQLNSNEKLVETAKKKNEYQETIHMPLLEYDFECHNCISKAKGTAMPLFHTKLTKYISRIVP